VDSDCWGYDHPVGMFHSIDDVENSYHVSLKFYVILLKEREKER
jgi:hypothetical protein